MRATTLTVQYALACLQALDSSSKTPLSTKTLSRLVGAPYEECQLISDRLLQAGILREETEGLRIAKELEDITSLDLLQALYSTVPTPTKFRMLVTTGGRSSAKAARNAVAQAGYIGAYPGDGGIAPQQPRSRGEERN